MQLKKFVAPLAAVAVVGTAVVAPSALFGATTTHHFVGYAGGTAVQALGTTVESDLTSASSVDTNDTGVVSTNTAATVGVAGVATVAAVNTSATTEDIAGGSQTTMSAQAAGVSLLNGAILAQAVTTVDRARVVGASTVSGEVDTQFVGLKIAGIQLPITIPKNFHVTIPNVANVWLNASFVSPGPAGSGTIMTYGAGIYIGLLQQEGNLPSGSFVFVNPTYGAIAPVTPVTGATIGGYAFGSKVSLKAGTLLSANSGPTAQIALPIDGTHGAVQTNTTTTVTLPSILGLGVVTSTAQGVKDPPTSAYSTMTTKLTGVNLLGGLITADALSGTAHVEALPGGGTKSTTSTSLVNLKVAGQAIDVNVPPNTFINIANVGQLQIRAEGKNANQALVTVLQLKITVANHGLPVGALVQIGVAAAWVFLP